MSCKSNPSSKPTKYKPMPMKTLLASIRALPAELNNRDSSDSSGDESDGYVKKPKVPSISSRNNSRDRSYFNRVHIMPTIEGSSSLPVTVEKVTRPPLLQKERNRCLFPEPIKEAAKEPTLEPVKEPVMEPPVQVVQPVDTQKPSSSSINQSTYPIAKYNGQAPNIPEPPVQAVQPVDTQKPSTYVCPGGKYNGQAHNIPQPPVTTVQPVEKQKPPNVPATPLQPTRNATVQYKSISIKGKKYMYIKKLGSGGSSSVYKMLEISTTKEYALKTVKLTGDREMQQGYINEVKVLRNLQSSDRVIKLYEFEHVKSANILNLLLEQGETDLATFLSKHTDGAPPALVLHYWEEMLKAVQQIHAHGIVHADLKPSNFLLVSGTLKLIDFGIASKVSSDATSVERSFGRGTFSYISPEALGGDGSQPNKVSFYSDVWSLGCILYGLIYGYTPFSHLSNMVKIVAIRDSNHHIVYPKADHVPASLLALAKQCLQYDAHSRPTVTQLLQINHLVPKRQLLPKEILDKLQPCLTAQEFNLLQSAEVPPEALD